MAVGLAMDAFAVSVTFGLTAKENRVNHALRMASSFGAFQAAMPVIGWLAGSGLRGYIAGVDHWLAFGLLSLIGVKMIIESGKMKSEGKPACSPGLYLLFMLSIATSIDALAVGLSLSFLNVPIVTPSLAIGVVTFALSLAGFMVGGRLGHFFENKIEIAGGLTLIGIGVKILIEHLFYLPPA